MPGILGLGHVGRGAVIASSSSSSADPQLQFFENFPGRDGFDFALVSQNTMSFQAVNIPLSISFNKMAMLISFASSNRSASVSFGLYSLNASTLSLANSASGSLEAAGGIGAQTSWMSFATSVAQNISPGAWYLGVVGSTAGAGGLALMVNSSLNPGNAFPGGFFFGRMTASTGSPPTSIATSDLDITGSDATRQPYVIITA